jgi:hypothetical protein
VSVKEPTEKEKKLWEKLIEIENDILNMRFIPEFDIDRSRILKKVRETRDILDGE